MPIVAPTLLKRRIVDQWTRSPQVVSLIHASLEMSEDQVVAIEDGFHDAQNLNLAEGVWLDAIGLRLGVPRPWLLTTATDLFSVRGPGRGYDQAPIQSADHPIENAFPIPDLLYRRLLRARRVAIFTRGTLAEFTRSVQYIDGDATVAESGGLHVTVTSDASEEITLADDHGCLARVAGVRMTITAP